ncbi:hypothetical protein [Arundinibacter roseus]|uniref:Uncharacterized protein n=1 Tax=Arundinibacter roseus TaxID=2070510 RepID=A0A4R4K4K4_9BACT|nr:hypothetical protein [Arundinibacter roseus]TDB62367.1 hypothetical protein EZE20_18470 [Arundinibacter roseus]
MHTQITDGNELYRTPKGRSWQCDVTNRVYIQFEGTTIAFKVQDFSSFYRKVVAVNIHEMIFNLSDQYDFERIEAPQNGVSLKLTLCEILQLRDLLDGTKFALKLNSLLHEVFGEVSMA